MNTGENVRFKVAVSPARLPYLPGLDGLRALAVLAVMLYHSNFGWMPGGFLGVEIFFVLSGYLITSLLLSEWNTRAGLDLRRFWLARARRLLPALFVAIAAALTFAVIFLPDEVAGLRGDALAAVGYVTNWYLIFAQKSYFATLGRPSLLRHLWSLAVEEQFYLLFPPLLLLLLKRFTRRNVFLFLLVGAAGSALLMMLLYQPDADPSRVYYGTDTRASGLLLGAALAFIRTPGLAVVGRVRRWLLDGIGLAALAYLVFACVQLNEFDPFLYRGGFLTVAFATLVVIAAVGAKTSRLGVGLGVAPLRWIGERSYSLYLWHWLVLDVTRPQLDVSLDGVPLFALQLVLAFLFAEVSYRWIETPIRRGLVGRSWNALRTARGARRRWLGLIWTEAIGVLVLVVILLGDSVASAEEPPAPPYIAIELAQETQTPAPALPQALPVVLASTTPTTAPSSTPTAGPSKTPDATPTSKASAPPAVLHITAVGDSVMLGAAPELQRTLGTVDVDAAVGRQVSQALAILQARRAANQLGDVVVFHLGNNGGFSTQQFNTLMGLLSGVQRIVIVTDKVPRPWESVNNAVLTTGVKLYPNVVLVDWYAASAAHPEYFYKDGIHLRPEGAQAYASLIAAGINAAR